MFPAKLLEEAADLLNNCKQRGLTLTCAESCTGGMLATLLTEISGSSAVFEGGFVTYSNVLKHEVLGVHSKNLRDYGAVSSEVAQEMATGARRVAKADIAISTTGVAGPTGGSPEKPVGLVFIGIATASNIEIEKKFLSGTRSEIRLQTVEHALAMLRRTLKASSVSFA